MCVESSVCSINMFDMFNKKKKRKGDDGFGWEGAGMLNLWPYLCPDGKTSKKIL